MKSLTIRASVLALCVIMVLAGCSTTPLASQAPTNAATAAGQTTAPAAAEDSNLTPPGQMPIVKEKQTFSIMIPWRGGGPIEENWDTIDYEKKTNVHIDWQVVPQEGWAEKKALVFASNSLPDAIAAAPQGVNLTTSEQMQYGSQGLLIPLNDYIDQYSMYFKKVTQDDPELMKICTSTDGKLYAFPDINVCYHCNYSQKMFINHVWLEKLGLKMPTTTDEFEAVLKAFKEKDPNGNGKADEVPLVTAVDAWQGQIDGYLMCAFTYTDGDSRLMVNDSGKIESVVLKPEYKEGIKYLSKLYSEGLIAPESFTQNWNTMQTTNEGGDTTVYGAIPAGANLFFAGGTSVSPRWKEYEILAPIAGPNGYKIAGNYTLSRNYGTGFFAITSAAKDPGMIVRWIDWLYSEEGSMWCSDGREGTEWAKADAGQLDYNGAQAKYKKLSTADYASSLKANILWGDQFPRYSSKENRECWAAPQDYFSDDPLAQEVQLFLGTKAYEKVAVPLKNVLPPLMVAADQVAEYTRLKTGIDDYIKESTAQFITGNKDPEKDWDGFLAELENLGMSKYIQMCQDAYDVKNK